MNKQTIKVITLDLDNTLWLTWPVIARANEALHNYISEKYPVIAHKYPPESWRQLQETVVENNPEFKTDFTKIRMKAIEVFKKKGVKWHEMGQKHLMIDKIRPTEKELSISHHKEGFATHIVARQHLVVSIN